MSMVAVAWLALQIAPSAHKGVWTAIVVTAFALPTINGNVTAGDPSTDSGGRVLDALNTLCGRSMRLGLAAGPYTITWTDVVCERAASAGADLVGTPPVACLLGVQGVRRFHGRGRRVVP